MRILFWGTPDFAVPALRALLEEGHHVVAVVTQPDRPAGRGRKLRPSPVREAAESEGVPVLTPKRPRGEAFEEELRALEPEISVVVAYGHILSLPVLELPEHGSWNIHASLLPELRGAAPIHHAILRGHDRTGITIMQMTEGLDAGPIVMQREIPIEPEDTSSGLALRLAELGAEAIVEALGMLEAGLVEPEEQDHARATYAPKVDREGARIDWTEPAREVADRIRGMDALPGAWSILEGESCKLFRPLPEGDSDRGARTGADRDPSPGAGHASPGTILEADPAGLLVATGGKGAVRVAEIQPPGRRRMPVDAWLRSRENPAGRRFQ